MSLGERPIALPENPFWNVFKRFGRDEFIAMTVSVVSTIVMGFFTASAISLSFAGPIIEKIGFFPAHFYESLKIYKTTPARQRKSRWQYFKMAMKGGWKSLMLDIMIHDPLYIFMFLWLKIAYPMIPVWLIAIVSFFVAVAIASVVGVGIDEMEFLGFKKKMKKAGFDSERYLESRFLIKSSIPVEEIKNKLMGEFNFDDVKNLLYHDSYFESPFPEFSGRTAKVRLRQRTYAPLVSKDVWEDGKKRGWIQSVQIVYTRPREINKHNLDQHRYFPARKEKIYHLLPQTMPQDISEIENPEVKKIVIRSAGFVKKISFKRTVLRNKSGLFIAIDESLNPNERDFYIMEIKTWNDESLILRAMRLVMNEFPVIQTTLPKCDLNF